MPHIMSFSVVASMYVAHSTEQPTLRKSWGHAIASQSHDIEVVLTRACTRYSAIAGGFGNTVPRSTAFATVAGGADNTASGYGAFVGGGGALLSTTITMPTMLSTSTTMPTTMTTNLAPFASSAGNVASGSWSAVLGGFNNTAAGRFVCMRCVRCGDRMAAVARLMQLRSVRTM